MLLDNYYENVSFSTDENINTSEKVSDDYTNYTHWHPFVEILLSLENGNEVTLNFKNYLMNINDFIISFPGDLHSIRNISPSSFLVIQFPITLLQVVKDLSKYQTLFVNAPYHKYDPYDIECEKMVHCLKEVVYSKRQDMPFLESFKYSKLLTFFSLYGTWCMQSQSEAVVEEIHSSSRLIAAACLYIAQNCCSPITISDVAGQVGISKSYFSHLFKDYTKTTFVDYLTKERIHRSESMFLIPGKKITDIAYECGFMSISSFNRTFKKIKGISPRQFKEAMIESVSGVPRL